MTCERRGHLHQARLIPRLTAVACHPNPISTQQRQGVARLGGVELERERVESGDVHFEDRGLGGR